jgi:hypothetical protein
MEYVEGHRTAARIVCLTRRRGSIPPILRRGSYAVAICHKPPAKYGGILEDFPLRSAGDCIREKTKHRPVERPDAR